MNNWEEWQTFRKDRGTPPWIKLHRKLMTSPKWVSLTDSEKGQLVSIWIVAADNNGQVPRDEGVLMKICMLDKKPNINKFIGLGLMSATCQPHDNHKKICGSQSDAPEESRGEESRGEKRRVEERRVEERSILDYLNLKTGRNYRPLETHLSLISQRLKEGHSTDDCMWVIDQKTAEWLTDENFNKFLRPATLFNASKFNNYIGGKGATMPISEKQEFYNMLDDKDLETIEGECNEII